MNILFVMRHALYLRNFEPLVTHLAERGHKVHLGFTTTRDNVDDSLAQRLAGQYSNVTFDYPEPAAHTWVWLTARVRRLRNFLRYFQKPLIQCRSLRARAEARVNKKLVRLMQHCPLWLGRSIYRIADPILAFIDDCAPLAPQVDQYIHRERYNLLLVSPLIDLDSLEIEYVKAARLARIPSCLCVASWDNLTNKGIIQGRPDFVIVWNDIQKQEAITLHNIAPERIYTTGAQLFDQWFERKPSYSREAFCEHMKLDPSKKIITYLCSSIFISRNEVDFVYDWAQRLRKHPDPVLAQASILIRPHPASGPKYWSEPEARFNHLDNFTIWPLGGQVPTDDFSKDSYFNTLYWSDVVVGINTSAFLEAGIVGTPCLTITDDHHSSTQDGTVHFHYLIEGGLVETAHDNDTHCAQILQNLKDPSASLKRAAAFIHSFIRPHGVDKPASEIFYETIAHHLPRAFPEAKRTQVKVRKEHRLVRKALSPFFDTATVKSEEEESWKIIKKKPKKKKRKKKATTLERIHEELDERKILLSTISRICKTDKPIILGPWLSEIGFEILYWIPFLQWLEQKYGVDPKRCTAVSRGGSAAWYQHVAGNYFEILDHYTPEDFFKKTEQRVKQAGGSRKQMEILDLDQELIDLAKETCDLPDAEVIHPSLLYNLFRPYWNSFMGYRFVERCMHYQHFQCAKPEAILEKMGLRPGEYTAVKFYYSAHFMKGPNTQAFIRNLITRLAEKSTVVLLETQFKLDDHDDTPIQDIPNVISIAEYCTPQNNLDVQSAIVAKAQAFYGTYGGFSYLAPLYGVPSYNFYCHTFQMITAHLQAAERAFRAPPFGRFVHCHINAWDILEETFFTEQKQIEA